MWLYCPKCNKSGVDTKNRSLYRIFDCVYCGHKFRGIHAKVNEVHRILKGMWFPFNDWSVWPEYKGVTPCPFCNGHIERGCSWPTVCKHCCKDLPTSKNDEPKPEVIFKDGYYWYWDSDHWLIHKNGEWVRYEGVA